jgi:hypothetical protein
MNRCRYRGGVGDTINVVLASLAWNTKKLVFLSWLKEEKRAQRALSGQHRRRNPPKISYPTYIFNFQRAILIQTS